MMKPNTKRISTKKLTIIALLGALSTAIMYLETPLPFMPPFLKLDLSAVPVMIGSFMFGPLSGIAVAAIKALIHLLSTQTAGVGELADFIMTSSFALTGGLIYKYNKSLKGALAASITSVLVLAIVGSLTNYFILIPFYAKAYMPMEVIIELSNKINPYITGMPTLVLFGILPFNLIKGIVIAVITFLLYKRISKPIHNYTK